MCANHRHRPGAGGAFSKSDVIELFSLDWPAFNSRLASMMAFWTSETNPPRSPRSARGEKLNDRHSRRNNGRGARDCVDGRAGAKGKGDVGAAIIRKQQSTAIFGMLKCGRNLRVH